MKASSKAIKEHKMSTTTNAVSTVKDRAHAPLRDT
jgi:hypothetical protein